MDAIPIHGFRLTALANVIACATGCYYESTQTATIDVSFANTTSNLSPSSTPISQPIDFDVTSADVATKEVTLNATVTALTNVENRITTTEYTLAVAMERRSTFPQQIEHLRATVSRLGAELKAAETQVVTAEQAFSDFTSTVERRKIDAKKFVATSVTEKYERTVAEIKLARQKRDELRARVGARAEDQSEAQLQSLRIRQARDHAQQTFTTIVGQESSRIAAHSQALVLRYTSAKSQLANLREERNSTETLVNEKHEELVATRETIAALPIKLAQLRKTRDRLVTLKLQQANDLRIAQTALRKKNELLAEQLRQQKLQRQQAETLAAASRSAPQYYTSTRINTGNSFLFPSTSINSARAKGKYYNYYYRPPVGDHYVHGHFRRDGTYVPSHRRTNADDSFWNNWSSYGNVNAYTGRIGTKLPSYNYRGGSTYVRGYLRSNRTYVSGHYRNR